MGIVGAGFVGPHHIDAVRRLGFVDVLAIAGSGDASAKAKADALGVPTAHGSYEALLADPAVQVLHHSTANDLHYRVNAAAITPAFGQHGGGGGGTALNDASDLSPAEVAAIAAMRELQQLAEVITIKATPEQIVFEDARGQRSYAMDGKTVKITVAGAEVSTKSRWDKAVLKQEFSTAQSKLTQTWNVDENGRLALVAKVESLKLMTPDQKAVFDRKQP